MLTRAHTRGSPRHQAAHPVRTFRRPPQHLSWGQPDPLWWSYIEQSVSNKAVSSWSWQGGAQQLRTRGSRCERVRGKHTDGGANAAAGHGLHVLTNRVALTGSCWVLASSIGSFAESELRATAATNAVAKRATAAAATAAAPPCRRRIGAAAAPTDPSAKKSRPAVSNCDSQRACCRRSTVIK